MVHNEPHCRPDRLVCSEKVNRYGVHKKRMLTSDPLISEIRARSDRQQRSVYLIKSERARIAIAGHILVAIENVVDKVQAFGSR